MWGGSSILSGTDYALGEQFNHTFDAIMTLSGCGGTDTHTTQADHLNPSHSQFHFLLVCVNVTHHTPTSQSPTGRKEREGKEGGQGR